MNFGQLKTGIGAFMSRSTNVFVKDGVDALGNAINFSRKHAERLLDFEFNKDRARLPSVSAQTGALFSQIQDLSGQALNVKGIERAWTADSNFNRVTPLHIYNSEAYENRQRRRVTLNRETMQPILESDVTEAALVLHGTRLYVQPLTVFNNAQTSNLRLDVVKWMPDYVADGDTDFLMDVGAEWLMYRTILQLNFYLKEDERLKLQVGIVDQAWKTIESWNNSLVAARIDGVSID